MCKDAPLFGHGLETFAQVFPIYQIADLDGKIVLHPESSWLKWLAELGVLPLALLAVALVMFVAANLRAAFEQRRSFFLTAGALAGVVAILVHALFDVPAHRWATAGFALALLGIAFPMRVREAVHAPRRIALVPFALGVFWVWPFVAAPPPWSPLAPTMLLTRETESRESKPSLAEFEAALRYFPLDSWMHQYAGTHALAEQPMDRARWEQHFAVTRRLAASAWRMPEMQARAARQFPSLAMVFWQDAVERAGRQRTEVLRDAVRETAEMRGARVMWGQFLESRPELALAYAQILVEELHEPDENVRAYYELWWEWWPSGEVSEAEADAYYRYAARWSSAVQLEQWMRHHATRRDRDYRVWTELLHGWKSDERAWQIYSGVMSEPVYGQTPKAATRVSLESRFRQSPENAAHALALAQFLDSEGDKAGAQAVILQFAGRATAPTWFLRRAAYLLAKDGKFGAAVELALREKAR